MIDFKNQQPLLNKNIKKKKSKKRYTKKLK